MSKNYKKISLSNVIKMVRFCQVGQYCNQRAKNVFCCKWWQYRNKLCSYNDRYIKNIFSRNFRKFLFVFKRAEIANKIKFIRTTCEINHVMGVDPVT